MVHVRAQKHLGPSVPYVAIRLIRGNEMRSMAPSGTQGHSIALTSPPRFVIAVASESATACMHSACTQHALSMHSACNQQHAISMQSMQSASPQPPARKNKRGSHQRQSAPSEAVSGGLLSSVVISRQSIAISMAQYSACNHLRASDGIVHHGALCEEFLDHERDGGGRSLVDGETTHQWQSACNQHAISMQSECNQNEISAHSPGRRVAH